MRQQVDAQTHERDAAPAQRWPLSAAMPPLAALPAAAASARMLVRLTLPDWGVPDLTSTAELIVSELVSNAVEASGRRGHIRVCLLCDGTRVVLEVWDQASGVPVLREAGVLDESGRGLNLVAALASGWGWHPAHGRPVTGARPGKCVWAVLLTESEG